MKTSKANLTNLIALGAALLASAMSCKKEEEKAAQPAEPAEETMATTTPPRAPTPEPAAVSTKTPEERVARFEQCWGFFNDRKWDDFKGCFTADAEVEQVDMGTPTARGADAVVEQTRSFIEAFPDLRGEPQLILAHENHVLGVMRLTGTHQGALDTATNRYAPSGKKIGYLLAHLVEVGDDGKASKGRYFADMSGMLGQIGALPPGAAFRKALEGGGDKEVVLAKNDDAEKQNVAAYEAAVKAYNAHDARTYGAMIADDATISSQALPEDQDKNEMLAGLAMFWKAFPDGELAPEQTWGAGEYTVSIGRARGTNKGDMKAMGVKATNKPVDVGYVEIVRWKDGKMARSWLFYNSAAMAQQLGITEPAKDKPAK